MLSFQPSVLLFPSPATTWQTYAVQLRDSSLMKKSQPKKGASKVQTYLALMSGSASSALRRFRGIPGYVGGLWTKKDRIVVKSGLRPALKRCAVHLPPIMATAVLSALNIRGYFIGFAYAGKGDSVSQSLYDLLLQVTAKLFVSTSLLFFALRPL